MSKMLSQINLGPKLLENLAGSGCQPKSGSNPERGLHPPLPELAKTHKVSKSHKLLCPHRNIYQLEALHQLIDKNAVELVQNQTSLGFFNQLFLVPKPNNNNSSRRRNSKWRHRKPSGRPSNQGSGSPQ